jgi:hypothetical protein
MERKRTRRKVDIRKKFKAEPFKVDKQRRLAKEAKCLKEITDDKNSSTRRGYKLDV